MNWRVIIRPNAEADVQEAWPWYESQRAGLGDELLDEIRAAVRRWKWTPNTVLFIIAIFAVCSPAGSLTNFFIAWKAVASLSFASCMRNGNTGGGFELMAHGRRPVSRHAPLGLARKESLQRRRNLRAKRIQHTILNLAMLASLRRFCILNSWRKDSKQNRPLNPKNLLDEIDRAIAKLRHRISEVEELKSRGTRFDAVEVETATLNIRKTVLEIFGANSPEYRQHQDHYIWFGSERLGMGAQEYERGFDSGIPRTLVMLNGLIQSLEEQKLDFVPDQTEKESVKTGPVFIGHGHAREWLALQDFLKDRLHLQCVEFNTESAAGIATTERLSKLLKQAVFAFLVMTAEDEQADGSKRARENVVHEAGLFQGRLTFKKAIIVLEEGCAEFSNIHGFGYIPFQKGRIESCFEDVRKVLEREKILNSGQQ